MVFRNLFKWADLNFRRFNNTNSILILSKNDAHSFPWAMVHSPLHTSQKANWLLSLLAPSIRVLPNNLLPCQRPRHQSYLQLSDLKSYRLIHLTFDFINLLCFYSPSIISKNARSSGPNVFILILKCL